MLIMGGLIVVGILALIGAFFLLREGKSQKNSQPSSQQKPKSSQPTVVQTVEDARPAAPTLQGPAPRLQSDAQAVSPGLTEDVQLAFPGEPAVQSQADVQAMGELAEQVYALQQQATEIEQRLRRLNKQLEIREQTDQTMVGIPALQRHRPTS